MHRRLFALALAAALALTSLVLAPGASNAASTAPGWQPAASMAFAGDSNAVALPDGRFFTVSQQGGVEVYDPIADRWSSAGPNVAGGATPVVLGDGRVLVVGGRYTNAVSPTVHARLYDPVSGTWASASDSPR